MKRRKSRYVDQRDIEACIDQLRAIIDGLRSGSMALEEEEQSLLLRPRGVLDFEVRVEQLGTKETLRVEMGWRLGQRGADAAAPESGPREVAWEGPIRPWPGPGSARDAGSAAEPPEAAGATSASDDEAVGEEEILADDLIEDGLIEDGLIEDGLLEDGLPEEGLIDEGLAEIDGAEVESAVMHTPPQRRAERSAGWAEDPISSWPPPLSVVAEYHQLYADACSVGSDGQWHIDREQLVQSLARAGVDPLTQQELYSLALQADVDRTSLFSARVIAALERASPRPVAAAG